MKTISWIQARVIVNAVWLKKIALHRGSALMSQNVSVKVKFAIKRKNIAEKLMIIGHSYPIAPVVALKLYHAVKAKYGILKNVFVRKTAVTI